MAVVFAQLEIDGKLRGRARVRRTDPGRGRASRSTAYASRTTAPRSASTASTTAGSGSTTSGCRATNLLNRYADVTEDGRYLSDIENTDRRFFTMLGTLIQGRVCVGGAGINASKVALAVAIKYANMRRQFGAPDTDEEELLLDYGMHQRRLLPLLAKTYALHFTQEILLAELHNVLSTTEAPRPAAPRAWSRGPPAPRRSAPGTPAGPSRSAARPAAARAT